MKLTDLLFRRNQLQSRLHERLRARDEALSALNMLDRLERDLPAAINELGKRPQIPYVAAGIDREDVVDVDLIAESESIVGAQAFLREIPALRKHWTAKLQAAMALIGQKAA